MIKHNIGHWVINEYSMRILLFAQSLVEGLFPYSYESYRLPALNSHYLCYDILRTAKDIEKKVLLDGNFVPLAEEFEQMAREDIFIKNYITEIDTLFIARDKNGDYYDLSESDMKSKIKTYPEIASYVKNVCEVKDSYLHGLLDLIIDNIFIENYEFENSKIIYSISRTLITEYVNSGYSKEYLYEFVNDYFFNPHHIINCDKDTIINFANYLTFDNHNYHVIFGVNIKASSILNKLDDILVRKPSFTERSMLNLQKNNDLVAVLNRESIDRYSAFDEAIEYMDTIVSLHSINQHSNRLYISSKAIVSKIIENEADIQDKLIFPTNPMKKTGNTTDLHAIINDITLLNNKKIPKTFYRAVALHNGALESKEISNQLLNLWTIVEILIDTKRDNEDKINTICNVLCSVLNRCYMYSQIEQLIRNIKSCSELDIDSILSKITLNANNLDCVEKTALLLTIDSYSQERDELISLLDSYPLLKYRVQLFANEILKDSQSIYQYLQRHEKRVRWHIMRIYRNRNMIIHSGFYMPYRNMVIENLHYYVDTLLDTLIEYYHFGLLSHQSIYHDIICEQSKYYEKLGFSLKIKKHKIEAKTISSDNALDFIFNGYSGSSIKKAIDIALKARHEKDVE